MMVMLGLAVATSNWVFIIAGIAYLVLFLQECMSGKYYYFTFIEDSGDGIQLGNGVCTDKADLVGVHILHVIEINKKQYEEFKDSVNS